MTATVRSSRTRKLITYADHWHTANTLARLAKEDPKGSYHQYLASISFRAFSLEAFLNHIGEEIFTSWKDIERLSTKGKINVVCEKLSITPDYGSMPWQIEPKLTAIRNKVAHGKNELLREEREMSADEYDKEMLKALRADWQEFASEANSALVEEETSKLMGLLWTATGHELITLFRSGIQTGSAEVIK